MKIAMNQVCSICGNSKNNHLYSVRERILNQGDTFHYLECSRCGTLMLDDEMDDLAKWYPDDYNPFCKKLNTKEKIYKKIRRKFLTELTLRLRKKSMFQAILSLQDFDILLKRLYGTRLKKNARILDVGCANGHWLNYLNEMGWKNITGVDLFYPDSNENSRKWTFKKGDIFSIKKETYDFITLHHSFEHMEHPLDVLKHLSGLLSDEGQCIISIPVMGGIAWKMFGVDFCQIDAPRHLYLYTPKSMHYLCRKAGLYIERILYDSHGKIFNLSSGYQKTSFSNDQLSKKDNLSPAQKEKYNNLAIESNKNGKGDQAIFYIRKR